MIEIHGERFRARAWWDDRNPGWYVEYLTEAGDCLDDSEKVWHPALVGGRDDIEAVTAIAAAYLAKLEREM